MRQWGIRRWGIRQWGILWWGIRQCCVEDGSAFIFVEQEQEQEQEREGAREPDQTLPAS